MKSSLIFLVIFFFSIFVFVSGAEAQINEATTARYLPVGLGLSFYQSKDEYNSPNRHHGIGSKFLIGYESFSPEFIQRENFSFLSGETAGGYQNKAKLNMTQTAYRGAYGFRRQNLSPDEKGLKTFIGFSLKVNFGTRENRRLYQFDGAATLAFTISATYDYPYWGMSQDRWFYDGSVSLPLIGWGTRPRYAAPAYEGDLKGYQKTTIGFIYFPKHFDFDLRFNANWNMGNGNLLRGSYRWWWYDSRLMHRVRMMENGLNFSLMTRLN